MKKLKTEFFNHNSFQLVNNCFSLLFVLLPIICFSQNNITISGYVDEAESGENTFGNYL